MRTKTSGQGRPKGALNKATADVKKLAGKYAPAAMKELGRLAAKAESEAARVSAIKELLDRAYGKAPVAVTVDADARLIVQLVKFANDPPAK